MSFDKTLMIIVSAFFVIFSIAYRFDAKYWLFEDYVHVVQFVRVSENSDLITFIDFEEMYKDSTYMEKYEIENKRPKPYTLVSKYKGTKIELSGDIKYLTKSKCSEKIKVVKEYERRKAQRIKEDLKNELLEQKSKEDIEAIETSKCK